MSGKGAESPEVIHRLSTEGTYPHFIHRLSTGYPQSIHNHANHAGNPDQTSLKDQTHKDGASDSDASDSDAYSSDSDSDSDSDASDSDAYSSSEGRARMLYSIESG